MLAYLALAWWIAWPRTRETLPPGFAACTAGAPSAPPVLDGQWAVLSTAASDLLGCSAPSSSEPVAAADPASTARAPASVGEAFRARFGERFALSASCGTTLEGPLACNVLPTAFVLRARVDGEAVIVFVDELGNDLRPRLVRAVLERLHRREVGPLVVYELSPFAAPVCPDLLREIQR